MSGVGGPLCCVPEAFRVPQSAEAGAAALDPSGGGAPSPCASHVTLGGTPPAAAGFCPSGSAAAGFSWDGQDPQLND